MDTHVSLDSSSQDDAVDECDNDSKTRDGLPSNSSNNKEIRQQVVIVTESGTSRAVRVYRGLELFLLAVLVFGLTLYLLHQQQQQSSGIQIMSISPKMLIMPGGMKESLPKVEEALWSKIF